jgi:uncharacterized membrane-anchored protein YhcB (DUF1043 family)
MYPEIYLSMFEQTPMSFAANLLTWSLTAIVCLLLGIYIGRVKKMAPILKKYEKDNEELRKEVVDLKSELTAIRG